MVTQVIKDIETKFGQMSITRGNKHVFLGMNITFDESSTVAIMMREYLEEAIE